MDSGTYSPAIMLFGPFENVRTEMLVWICGPNRQRMPCIGLCVDLLHMKKPDEDKRRCRIVSNIDSVIRIVIVLPKIGKRNRYFVLRPASYPVSTDVLHLTVRFEVSHISTVPILRVRSIL